MARVQTYLVVLQLFYTGSCFGNSGDGDPEEWLPGEEIEILDEAIPGGRTFVVGDKEFIFFSNRTEVWEEARYLCSELVPGSHLAVVNETKMVEVLSGIITNHPELLNDTSSLWVDGVYHGSRWLWKSTYELIPCHPVSNGYPPWVGEYSLIGKNCLSIEKLPWQCVKCNIYFRGRDCEERNGFLCLRGL